MAWYKTGGGGSNIKNIEYITEAQLNIYDISDEYTYDIITTATGGSTAAVRLIEYHNGVETQNINFLYSGEVMQGTGVVFGNINLDYNITKSSNWTVHAISGKGIKIDGVAYDDTYKLQWSYSTTINKTGVPAGTPFPFPFDKHTLYNLYDIGNNRIYKQYLGNKILSNYKTQEEIEDYDYYYENLQYNYDINKTFNPDNFGITTPIRPFYSDNVNRNWQMDFSVNFAGKNAESTVIGATTSGVCEIFFSDNYAGKISFYGSWINNGGSDRYDYVNGQEVNFIRQNGNYIIKINGVEVANYAKSVSNSSYYFRIGEYSGGSSYVFHGTINYLGFKWLD